MSGTPHAAAVAVLPQHRDRVAKHGLHMQIDLRIWRPLQRRAAPNNTQ